MPFGPYKNFRECERKARQKGIKNTGAYCGAIEARIKKYKMKHKK